VRSGAAKIQALLGVGFAAGLSIAGVDNFAFDGEVSPIIIVAMLIAVSAAIGTIWGFRGWIASAAVWICVPLPHVIKRVLSLPDTFQPNTYKSILMLAAFTLFVTALGTSSGLILRRFVLGLPRKQGRV
jgi:hypothetical protein